MLLASRPGQPPAFGSMSKTLAATPSSSNIESIFDTALKSYKKKTRQDLKTHDFFKQLEKCDSPGAILAAFQADQFGPSQTSGNDGLKKWFVPTINVLYAFSATLSEGIALVFSPAKVVFAGVGVLLLAARDVAASQDILVEIFGRIDGFFSRLEIYTGVPLIPAMRDKMVEITVEVLDIIATATKEMKQSRTKKFVKRVAGRTDLEDGLKKLDKLTNEESLLASAQLLKVTHDIHNEVTVIADGVDGVEETVQVVVAQVEDVKYDVQVVSDQVEVVDQRVQVIVDVGKEVMAATMETKLIVQQTANNIDDAKRNHLRESLRKWQSPPDPSTSHNFASDRQHEGTAEWFIEDEKFREWKATGSLLWVHGKPGSGKSVLCSAIINDITTLCENGSASMAYFYFDFRDVNKQARRNLLPSLLTQLSNCSDHFCDIFSRLYGAHDNGARQPSDSALMQCLKEMLTPPTQGPVYLIMDALDECPDTSDLPSPREQVLDLVKDLVGLQFPSLHICVTSRPEVDINDAFESLASHTVSLQDESGQRKDIADYVRSVVYSGSGKFMRRWRQEDKDHVIETLSERADGMFRWVFCQLQTLRNCLPQNVRAVLKELPTSLDETYERILIEIGRVNPHQAYRLLQCLAVATRPLRVEELAEVLALDFDKAKNGIPALNKDWRWDDQQQGVISMCSSLIIVNDVDDRLASGRVQVVQFAHFSVKEFLTSERLANLEPDISHFHIRLEPAHTIVAQACLAILLQSHYNDRVESNSPLLKYAAQYWVDHAHFENVSLRVEDGMRRLFDPEKPYFAAWLKSYIIDKQWRSFLQDDFDTPEYRFASKYTPTGGGYAPLSLYNAPLCLYTASLCGFPDLTEHLIAEYPEHVNARVGFNKSPLVAALRNRHWQVAELLYQNGAAVDVTGDDNRTPLHAASKEGSVDVARWLLDHGADANSRENNHITPLHLAAANGHLELVRTLLEHSVDVNAATRDNRTTPLHRASEGGHVDIVRLLIRHGADANTHLQRLLILASSSRSVETVQLFIGLGADINAQDVGHSTPLHLASSKGDAETVQFLLKLGADVNAWDGSHSTPLHVASSTRNTETLQLMNAVGADADASYGGHSIPFHLTSSKGNTDTMRLLIENGADVNAWDGSHSTPLHLASSKRNTETVQLLIEHGADINAWDGSHKTALHLALSPVPDDSLWMLSSDQRVMQLLIEHGADVNAWDGNHATPLHLASSMGYAGTVQLLIGHGARVNEWDGSHSTPLHLASSTGNTETVQRLIENGADVNAWDGSHSTPLHLASFKRNTETVQLLIEHGVNVNAWDGSHKTALHVALSPVPDDSRWLSSDQRIVQLLIENGADVNCWDGNHSTPLHPASSTGKTGTVRRLIERGANVNAWDGNHSTALHLASSKRDAETVQLLIELGADVNARDGSRRTPLHLALSPVPDDSRWMLSSDHRIIHLLIEHGADVNAWDRSHSTPLHLASSTGDAETVRRLIEHGADVNAYNESHSTPLHLATSSQVPEADVVRLLLEHGASVDAEDDKGRTPLQVASSRGQYEIKWLFSL